VKSAASPYAVGAATKLALITDLAGVAAVLNFEEWTAPGSLRDQIVRGLLTHEANAVVDGLCEGPGAEVLVARRAALS